MTERIPIQSLNTEMMNPMLQLVSYLKSSDLDPQLLELINYRVSQINGCAYWLDMHYKEAMAKDEEALRLRYSLPIAHLHISIETGFKTFIETEIKWQKQRIT